jgi:hypothetical protein
MFRFELRVFLREGQTRENVMPLIKAHYNQFRQEYNDQPIGELGHEVDLIFASKAGVQTKRVVTFSGWSAILNPEHVLYNLTETLKGRFHGANLNVIQFESTGDRGVRGVHGHSF